jgi:hypothetical protein
VKVEIETYAVNTGANWKTCRSFRNCHVKIYNKLLKEIKFTAIHSWLMPISNLWIKSARQPVALITLNSKRCTYIATGFFIGSIVVYVHVPYGLCRLRARGLLLSHSPRSQSYAFWVYN